MHICKSRSCEDTISVVRIFMYVVSRTRTRFLPDIVYLVVQRKCMDVKRRSRAGERYFFVFEYPQFSFAWLRRSNFRRKKIDSPRTSMNLVRVRGEERADASFFQRKYFEIFA